MSAIPTPVSEIEVDELYYTSELPWHATMSPRVLIVEDDPDLLRGLRVFLDHQGYDTRAVSNGADGLSVLEREEPDLVVLDLGLPGMHGFKVLHEIRMRNLDTHVIVLTASASPEVERRAYQQGASCVFAKPMRPQDLTAVIERLLAG